MERAPRKRNSTRPAPTVFQNAKDVNVSGGTFNVAGGNVSHETHNYSAPVYNTQAGAHHHSGPVHNSYPNAHNVNAGLNQGTIYMGTNTVGSAPASVHPPSTIPMAYSQQASGNHSPSAPPQTTNNPSATAASGRYAELSAEHRPYTDSGKVPEHYHGDLPRSSKAARRGLWDRILAFFGLMRMQ